MSFTGKLLYSIYYRPVQKVRETFKVGLKRTALISEGKKKMIEAASNLKEICYDSSTTHKVYFLTGKKYWFQTAFCLYSLQLHAGTSIHAILVDDGSFDDELGARVKVQFPTTVTIVRANQVKELLDEKLPLHKFPVLRQRRIVYPHLRKLTDIHVLPGDGPKLVLDSDMLFFRRPTELLNWLSNPRQFLFMRDVEQSYGYSERLMMELASTTRLPKRLNVGVAGITTTKIDWDQLEYWTKQTLEEEGSSYLQEQGLTAMLAAKEEYVFLDEMDYKVLPTIKGCTVPETLHHYVAEAKYDYFVKGWKFFITPEA